MTVNLASNTLLLVLSVAVVASPARILGESVSGQPANVVVRIGSGIHPAFVKRGLAEAARIFRRGGVVIEWRDSAAVHDQSCLNLMVLLRDVVRVGAEPALGTTPHGPGESGQISYVFLEAIEALASSHGVDPSLVLGAAIAHELGHLLLPDREHTNVGLMRASWGGDEAKAANQGVLRFLPSDFTAMRGRLAPFVVDADGHRQGQP